MSASLLNTTSRWRIDAHHSSNPSKAKNVSNWQMAPPGVSADVTSLGDAQRQLQQLLTNQEKRRILQKLTQIGGVQRYADGPRSWDRPLYAFRGGLRGAGASSTASKIAANIERGF